MSNDIPFDNVIIGHELGPIDIPVDNRIIRDYCEEFGDHNPIYLEDSPFDGPVVPPLFQATLHNLSLLHTRWDTHATVPSKIEHMLINPAGVGKRLFTRGKIIDKYIKRGREYVVVQSAIFDEDDLEIRQCVDHVLLSLERTSQPDTKPARVAGQSVGNRDKIGGGTEIPPVEKTAFQRALVERTFLSDSIHNQDYAKSLGYPGRLVSGYVLCAYMSEMLVNFFGPGWLKGGRFKASFISPGVQEGDVIRCRGVIVNETRTISGKHMDLDIWIEKAHGIKVLIGRASGIRS